MKFVALTVSLGLLTVAGMWSQAEAPQSCRLTVALVDAQTGQPLSGWIRAEDAAGQPLALAGLMSRGTGLPNTPLEKWSVIVEPTTLEVPARKLKLVAFSGLETETKTLELDLTGKRKLNAELPLDRFYQAQRQGYVSANTHLHLMKLSRQQADRYLREIPRADGLDIVFLSYLERDVADLEYTSNKYTDADLRELSSADVQFGNGQEHRHNFGAGGEGYGHVMFLNIAELVQPVSIGPGIMNRGTDGIPIQRGIDTARSSGATAIWCHNSWGREDLPNWYAGKLDAQNIFDGGTHGSYKDSFYEYLNAGLRVPFSTGTDWFMYDLSRAYVLAEGKLTPGEWLEALAAGRSYITNGPFLEWSVEGKTTGDVLKLQQPGTVRVSATALGRVDFEWLELIQNGQVVKRVKTEPAGGHVTARFEQTLELAGPCWLAVRTPPPPVKDDATLQALVPLNECGKPLFAHTSAIYVEVAGKSLVQQAAAERLLADMQRSRAFIGEHGKFADDAERSAVLGVYDRAIKRLDRKLKQ